MRLTIASVSFLALIQSAAADIPSMRSHVPALGNHAPALSHPKGLTADRKSIGAQSLKLPPGLTLNNVAHVPALHPQHLGAQSAVNSGNHAPSLSHLKGRTANGKSLGARSLVMPKGAKIGPSIKSANTNSNIQMTAPERVHVWDIDMKEVAITRNPHVHFRGSPRQLIEADSL